MTVFGRDAYPSLEEKAGALLNFLARNLGLVDGKNKPLALAATIAFLGLNGYRLTLTNDEAYTLVMEVAAGGWLSCGSREQSADARMVHV